MKQLRYGIGAVLILNKSPTPNAPPQPIFFPKFQIFFADFPNSTFLPLARDCASWEPAADISTARFVNEWFFLRPHGFQGWMKNDNSIYF